MPKTEQRSSKEARKPKVEYEIRPAGDSSSEAWVLRDEPAGGANGKPAGYDLEERTAKSGEAIIELTRKIPRGPGNDRIIDQLVGCGTSIGANYAEAVDTLTHKEFIQCIGRCRRESRETRFFLRMTAKAQPSLAEEARRLWREARELNLIFGSMIRKK
jgi:four helix bundle protein